MRVLERIKWWHGAILIGLIAAILVPLSSDLPDGLEWMAERLSFKEFERQLFKAPFSDYSIPSIQGFIGTVLSALIGVLVVSVATYIVARALAKWRSKLTE
ncbi:MAG: PDGLE domain-containing protein [Armatimonadota bacterium]|nr:PDGLE domain-containing protein [Armatimonadota bacterium]MCX7777946.1 PDGLE domain-containing protein [Armatimonadota bacterium]MDW8025298.1 PDGLE domain-containing protein [Armatimonadota bacterium]